MQEPKTAFVTGAAVNTASENLHDFRPNVRGVRCDVADPASVEHAAKTSYEAFGNVHVLCNNAGVGGGSGIGLDATDVAAQVLTAIRENELYVFTHSGADWRAELEERFAAILAAMDKAAAH